MIYIGLMLGGPEVDQEIVGTSLKRVAQAAVQARGQFRIGEKPAINVVFQVGGSLMALDFDEMREGKFSSKQKLLMIQIPVSRNFSSRTEVERFAINELYKANAFAFHYFKRKKLSFDLNNAEELVARISSGLKKL